MQQIGRYEVERELGRGAMGVVYLARDTRIGRSVALKTIRLSDFADAEKLQRLRERLNREAQSAGILSHDNIVTIYDVDEENGLSYISMEFVEGESLERMLERRRELSRDSFFSMMRQMASALDFAHSRGIVHRDIKPPNVMVTPLGRVKITDFGVAKVTHASSMTQGGAMLGTPDYMSPEQIAGSGVDGRADQFSLAVIAFELLAGEKPFVAETLPALFYRIAHEPSPDVTLLNPSLGEEIGRVLERAMAKNIDDRFETCSAFVEALVEACERSPGWHPLPRGMSQTLPTMGDAAARAPRKTTEDSERPGASTLGPADGETGSSQPGDSGSPDSRGDQPTGPLNVPHVPPPPLTINPFPDQQSAHSSGGGGFITGASAESSETIEMDGPAKPDWLRDALREEADRKKRKRRGLLVALLALIAVAAAAGSAFYWLGGGLPGWGTPSEPQITANADPEQGGQEHGGEGAASVPPAGEGPTAPAETEEASGDPADNAGQTSQPVAEAPKPVPPASEEPTPAATKPIAPETPAPKPREPARPAGRLATVRFMSEPPGATVTVDADSRLRCETPCTLDMPVGRHTYSLRMNGYRNEIKLIELSEVGQTVSVKLQRRVGMVRVVSTPRGATIYVNGEKQGPVTPATLRLLPGNYRISIERDGLRAERNVSVKEDAVVQIEATLPE